MITNGNPCLSCVDRRKQGLRYRLPPFGPYKLKKGEVDLLSFSLAFISEKHILFYFRLLAESAVDSMPVHNFVMLKL